MTINTKYNIGDKVYLMSSNHIVSDIIKSINIQVIKNEPIDLSIIKYELSNQSFIDEILCFSTKNDLIDKLLKDSDK